MTIWKSLAVLFSIAVVGSGATGLCRAAAKEMGARRQNSVQIGQVFYRGDFDQSLLCGTRGIVWSSTVPVSCTNTLRYLPAYRLYFDPISPAKFCSGSACTDWLYANHPDWIMYLDDRKTIAYEFGNSKYPSVDFTNPSVVDFLAAQDRFRANGFNGLGLDNLSAQNSFLEAGHYAETSAPCGIAARPACGGRWVQTFNGTSPNDAAWRAANADYLRSLRSALTGTGLSLFGNLSYQARETHVSLNLLLDGSMAENWTQHGCITSPNQWLNGFTIDRLWQDVYFNSYSDLKRWWFGLNYLCNHGTSGMTKAEESWGLGNFFLATQHPTKNYLSLDASGASNYSLYPDSVRPPVGRAIEPPPVPGSCGGTGIGANRGICSRRFEFGIVAVNSSGENTLSFTLADGDWVDQFCTKIRPGRVSLPPATAIVIVRHPNSQCH